MNLMRGQLDGCGISIALFGVLALEKIKILPAPCNTPRNLDHWLSLYINFKTDQTDETNTAKILF